MSETPCDCLACMIPASECQICRESELESERNRAIAERDTAEAKLKALRDAAGALLAALAQDGRPCGVCYTIATWAEPLPRGGSAYRCDRHHKHDDPDEDGLCPSETKAAIPLRALRALLETKP